MADLAALGSHGALVDAAMGQHGTAVLGGNVGTAGIASGACGFDCAGDDAAAALFSAPAVPHSWATRQAGSTCGVCGRRDLKVCCSACEACFACENTSRRASGLGAEVQADPSARVLEHYESALGGGFCVKCTVDPRARTVP